MDSKNENVISNQERLVPAPVRWYCASFLAARLIGRWFRRGRKKGTCGTRRTGK
jgi:hypothetical protein